MPVQQGKSNVLAQLPSNFRSIWDKHKNDEVRQGFQDPPAGITGGVCRLQNAELGTYSTEANRVKDPKMRGKPYVRFVFVAHLPVIHNGVQVYGMQFSRLFPLCETEKKVYGQPGTFEANVSHLMEHLQKFGINTGEIEGGSVDLQSLLDALVQVKPFIRFSTEEGKAGAPTPENPNPKPPVFTNYHGLAEPPANAEGGPPAGMGVRDSSRPVSGGANGSSRTGRGTATVEPDDVDELPFDDGATAEDQDEDATAEDDGLDELATKAADDDKEAIKALRDAAKEAGLDPKTAVDKVDTWQEAVDNIRAARGTTDDDESSSGDDDAGATDEAPAAEKPPPAKEDVYLYTPTGPDGKPAKDPKNPKRLLKIECEVTAVDKKNKTVNLLNLDDRKTKYEKVAWDRLQDIG